MKILIAPDKFKGVSTAQEIAEQLRNFIQKQMPQAQIRLCPVADGGEGTLTSIIYLLKGKTSTATVHDPLMRPKQAYYGLATLPEKDCAVIEMAQASGLFRLTQEERNPLETTSYGTGELVLEAYKNGARNIRISLGGSATVDGGLGFLQALGAKLKTKSPLSHGAGGKHLHLIQDIDLDPILQKLKDVVFTGLVDVQVPLLGDHGAAQFFGPQKGANAQMVEELEKGLFQFEAVLSKASKVLLKNQRGAGAAGGLGMAILALGGKLESGFEFVAQTLKLEDQMRDCDLVITGEGRLDRSSLEGKAPVAVSLMAKKLGIPCIAIVGAMDPGITWLKEVGLSKVFPLFDTPFVMNDPRKSEVSLRLAEVIPAIFQETSRA
jgi:glycerate kinase